MAPDLLHAVRVDYSSRCRAEQLDAKPAWESRLPYLGFPGYTRCMMRRWESSYCLLYLVLAYYFEVLNRECCRFRAHLKQRFAESGSLRVPVRTNVLVLVVASYPTYL